MSKCTLCPRNCGVDRSAVKGYCGAGADIEISKVMIHHWEEPCISGSDPEKGSGAIFLTHCPLGCVYCQNKKISCRDSKGTTVSTNELAQIMLDLQGRGAYNINFVSPTQYTPGIISAVKHAKDRGLSLPIVWNTGGYESPETIRSLSGTVDIFLTDFKYASSEIAEKYSNAPDYPKFALKSLSEMYSLVGKYSFDENGMLRKGIIIRHLVLPSHKNDSVNVLRTIAEAVPPEDILLSLMSQFTKDFLPDVMDGHDKYSSLRRKITTYEYEFVKKEAVSLGFDGFSQDRVSARTDYTPDF